MNSKQRRTCIRHWTYDTHISGGDDRLDECFEWLTKTFGSCSIKRKSPPKWYWRNEYIPGRGNFTMHSYGARVYFRNERDYATFLLRWEQ
jgi:hypothetical protein